MDKLLNFFMIIAWIFAIICTVAFSLCLYMNLTYPGSVEEIMDRARGIKKEWPGTMWFIGAIICWAFIFSFK